MSEVKTEFLETSADFKVESLPLSHVSVEIGHLYMEDFARARSAVRRAFAAAAPWVRTARTPQAVGCDKKSVRVSTCFLIDDYFSRFSSPAAVIPMVLAAAEREGRGDRLPGARVGLRERERHQPSHPDAGEPGDRAGARNHRRAPAAHRDRLADQRPAVAGHLPRRGDGQAHARGSRRRRARAGGTPSSSTSSSGTSATGSGPGRAPCSPPSGN